MNRVSKEERAQRIRNGLAGLSVVFLLLLLATAISRSSEEPGAPTVHNELAEPADPLAEIGAAPGMTQDNESGEGAPARQP